MLNDDRKATSPSVSSPAAFLVGSVLALKHNMGTSPFHALRHPSILALNTYKTFSNFLATPGGPVEAALAVAWSFPEKSRKVCAGIGEWRVSKQAVKVRGRDG